MGRFLILLALLLFSQVPVRADEGKLEATPAEPGPSEKPKNEFYADIDEPAYVGASLGFPSAGFAVLPFSLSQGANWGGRIDYRPATNIEFGLHARYRFLSGSVTFHLPQIFPFQAQEGTSTYQMYGLNFYGQRLGAEVSYSRISGYLIDPSSVLTPATLSGATYYLLPQMTNLGIGANFYFVFSPDLYSLSAAFDQGQRQLQSAGSALLNLTLRYQSVDSPSGIIPTEKQALFGSDGPATTISTVTATLGGGYGFQLAFSPFFLSTALMAGIGPQLTSVTAAGTSSSGLAPALHGNGRVSIGWNATDLLVGIATELDGYTALTRQTALVHLGAEARFFLGLRF